MFANACAPLFTSDSEDMTYTVDKDTSFCVVNILSHTATLDIENCSQSITNKQNHQNREGRKEAASSEYGKHRNIQIGAVLLTLVFTSNRPF